MIVNFVWNCSPFVSYHLIWILPSLFSISVFETCLFGSPFFLSPNDSMFWSNIILILTPLFEALRSWLMMFPFDSMKVAILIESPFVVVLICFTSRSDMPPSAKYCTVMLPDLFSSICSANCSIELSEKLPSFFSRL